jgi:hypothetical protein
MRAALVFVAQVRLAGDGGEELGQQRIEKVRSLEARQVGGVFEDHGEGVLELLGEVLVARDDVGHIELADHQQHRGNDGANAAGGIVGLIFLGQLGMPEARRVHFEEQLPRRPVDTARLAQRAIEPQVRLDAVDALEVAALLGVGQRILETGRLLGNLGILGPGDGCTDEDEADGPLGVLEGEIDGKTTAHRGAHEYGGMDGELVEHRLEIDEVAERHVFACGLAKAAAVVGNDVVALGGEERHLPLPHAAIGDAGVEEHHGDAEPAGFAAQYGAVKGDFERRGHLAPTDKRRRRFLLPVASLDPGGRMAKHRIYSISMASVYPLYVQKAERKERTKAEVDEIIRWLTGHTQKSLEKVVANGTTLEDFYSKAPKLNPSRGLITGVICGMRVEEIEDPLMREIRYLDKLIDELARGKKMEKILRA